jgi:hypothetical protein
MDSLTDTELQDACQERGIIIRNVSIPLLRDRLRSWINLSTQTSNASLLLHMMAFQGILQTQTKSK